MRIVEAADYILGRRFLSEEVVEPFRGSLELLQLGRNLLQKHQTASLNLDQLESYKVFYKMEPDLEKEVAKEAQEELFYALKLNYLSPLIPAKSLYLFTKIYNLYGSLNLIPKALPRADLSLLFTKGYVAEGYTVRDVLCTLFDEQYKPLSEGELCVPNKKNWDIYIEETDMVAIVPTEIRNRLTNDDIKRLKVEGKEIKLGGTPIRFLGTQVGAVNSTYDLSGLV